MLASGPAVPRRVARPNQRLGIGDFLFRPARQRRQHRRRRQLAGSSPCSTGRCNSSRRRCGLRPCTNSTVIVTSPTCTLSPTLGIVPSFSYTRPPRLSTFFGRQIEAGFGVQVGQRQTRVDDPGIGRRLLDQRLFDVILVLDLADDLFEQVLDRHQAGSAAVLVHHDRDMHLARFEIPQQGVDLHRFGHEIARPHVIAQRCVEAAVAQQRQQIAHVQHAGDTVNGIFIHGNTRVACLECEVHRVGDARLTSSAETSIRGTITSRTSVSPKIRMPSIISRSSGSIRPSSSPTLTSSLSSSSVTSGMPGLTPSARLTGNISRPTRPEIGQHQQRKEAQRPRQQQRSAVGMRGSQQLWAVPRRLPAAAAASRQTAPRAATMRVARRLTPASAPWRHTWRRYRW